MQTLDLSPTAMVVSRPSLQGSFLSYGMMSASRFCSQFRSYGTWLWVFTQNMGVSENVVYPIVPNGFADHYPY